MNKLINHKDSIFIAGANGMVGGAIKRQLLKYGYGNKSCGGKIYAPSRSELDLTDFMSLNSWLKDKKPSVVIIAAAKVGGILANSKFPTEFILNNLKIQTNLIELSRTHNVRRLLFLGSSCIYPKFSSQPIREDELLTKSLEQTNQYYAIAKIAGIKLCEAMRKQYNFDSICLMPTNLYGPKDNYNPKTSHVIPGLINKFYFAKKNNLESVTCWGSGKPLREFLYVEDLADACIFALEHWDPHNENNKFSLPWINVGSEFELSIKELATLISNEINYTGQILWDKRKPDGTPRKKLETSRLTTLGWTAKTNLTIGIKKTIEEFKKEIENNFIKM